MTDKDHLFWNALKKSRRMRNPLLGLLLILLGVAAGTGVGWWLYKGPYANSGQLGGVDMAVQAALVFGILTALPFFLWGRRFLPREAPHALKDKNGGIRPFVLYLRAFQADAGWHAWFTEPRLARVLKRVGVPVCVGRPGERLSPFGFFRIYFADQDWKQSVLTMAARAQLIVVLIGETSGLAWEIQQLLGMSWLEKTILLLPARGHEKYRQQLRAQHEIVVPELQAHYDSPLSWRRFDLCPVDFPEPGPRGRALVVIPTKGVLSGPVLVLYRLFCLAVVLLSFVIPWLKRFDGGGRSLNVDYAHTLEPALKRLFPGFSTKVWDRFT